MTTFAELHVPGQPLVLANAWDAASAAVIASLGARAIATTSGGAAWSLGRADGNALLGEDVVSLTARIVRVVNVPLSVDLESGYSPQPAAVALLAARLAGLGAAGINLEDTWGGAFLTPAAQADRIRAVRAAAPVLFVNARTDAFLYGLPHAEEQTVERAAAAIEAGAHGVFVPGVTALDVLERLVDAINAPVAVMARVGGPTVQQFAAVGVARVSVGTALAEAAYRQLHDDTASILTTGSFDGISAPYGYGALNTLLS